MVSDVFLKVQKLNYVERSRLLNMSSNTFIYDEIDDISNPTKKNQVNFPVCPINLDYIELITGITDGLFGFNLQKC